MLELRGVRCSYGKIEALKGVDLEVKAGTVVTLIGSNGAGKSTTLMAICGHRPLSAGTITLDGEPIHGLPPHEVAARGVVQVPEGRRIFTRMSVRENLLMGAFLRKDAPGIARDMDHVLGLFPLLRERLAQNAGTLSGGEQQMLAIARGLMARPRILLLDEPSLGLSPTLVTAIFDILGTIHREGVTLLLVEQNVHRALSLAQYGYVLATGTVAIHDTAERLLENEEVRRAYLGDGS